MASRPSPRPPRTARVPRRRAVVVLAGLVLLVLAGCYFPARFTAEITLARNGTFDAAYSGDLIWVPFYQRLRQGGLPPREEADQVALITTDLTRDAAVKSVRYLGHGRFHAEWREAGDLLAVKMVSFVRRDAPILVLKYLKDEKTITLAGYATSRANAERLTQLGLGDEAGVLRVRTDGVVREHNATTVAEEGGGVRLYTWRITGVTDPPPRLVIALR